MCNIQHKFSMYYYFIQIAYSITAIMSILMLDFADASQFEENKVKKEIEEGVEPSLFLQLIFS